MSVVHLMCSSSCPSLLARPPTQEGFGIRLNKKPPNIYLKKKDRGGINFSTTVCNVRLCARPVREYRPCVCISVLSRSICLERFHCAPVFQVG